MTSTCAWSKPGSQFDGALGPRSPRRSALRGHPVAEHLGERVQHRLRQTQRPQPGERERDVHRGRRRRRPRRRGRHLRQHPAHQRARLGHVDDPQPQVGGSGHRVAAQDVALDVLEVDRRGPAARGGGTFGGAAEHQNSARKRSCSVAASSPCAAAAKPTIRSRSASASRTSATVAPGIADAHRLVRIACVVHVRAERGGVLAPRVAGAAAPPLVGLRNSDTECIQIAVERAVVRAGEHELRDPQRVRPCCCRGPWWTSEWKICTRARWSISSRANTSGESASRYACSSSTSRSERREHRQRVRHQSFASDRNRSYAALNSSGPSRSASRSSAAKRSRTASAFWTIRVLASACAQ